MHTYLRESVARGLRNDPDRGHRDLQYGLLRNVANHSEKGLQERPEHWAEYAVGARALACTRLHNKGILNACIITKALACNALQ